MSQWMMRLWPSSVVRNLVARKQRVSAQVRESVGLTIAVRTFLALLGLLLYMRLSEETLFAISIIFMVSLIRAYRSLDN